MAFWHVCQKANCITKSAFSAFEKKEEEEKKEKEEKEGVLTNGPKEGEKVESKPSNNIAASFAAQVRCHCDCF